MGLIAPFVVEGIEFPRMLLKHIGKILAKIRADREADVIRIAQAEKLSAEQRAKMRAVAAREGVELSDLLIWASSLDNALYILRESLKLRGVEGEAADEILAKMPWGLVVNTAVEVLSYPPPPETKKNPPQGGTGSGPTASS